MSKLNGTVKWFNATKGFGFITPEMGGKDLFVHFSGIIGDNYRTLQDGAKVQYEVQDTDRGPAAINVVTL